VLYSSDRDDEPAKLELASEVEALIGSAGD